MSWNRKYTLEQLKAAIEASMSWRGVARELGFDQASGTSVSLMRRTAEEHGFDSSHFKYRRGAKISTEEILTNQRRWTGTSGQLKVRLLKEGYFTEDRCDKCGLGAEWQGAPLTLQLDHVDGDPTNNTLDNLKIICPNCHTQTPTWGGRNIQRGPTNTYRMCRDCGCQIWKTSKRCVSCSQKGSARETKCPSIETLIALHSQFTATEIATQYGVSGSTVRKWMLRHGIQPRERGYWQKKRSNR